MNKEVLTREYLFLVLDEEGKLPTFSTEKEICFYAAPLIVVIAATTARKIANGSSGAFRKSRNRFHIQPAQENKKNLEITVNFCAEWQ